MYTKEEIAVQIAKLSYIDLAILYNEISDSNEEYAKVLLDEIERRKSSYLMQRHFSLEELR